MNLRRPIIDGKPCIMITPHDEEEAARSCKDRVGKRFTGFDDEPESERSNRPLQAGGQTPELCGGE